MGSPGRQSLRISTCVVSRSRAGWYSAKRNFVVATMTACVFGALRHARVLPGAVREGNAFFTLFDGRARVFLVYVCAQPLPRCWRITSFAGATQWANLLAVHYATLQCSECNAVLCSAVSGPVWRGLAWGGLGNQIVRRVTIF